MGTGNKLGTDMPEVAVEAAPADVDFGPAYASLRGDEAIQFAEVPMPQQPAPPDWLVQALGWLAELLAPLGGALVSGWPVLKGVLAGLALALLALLLWRLIGPALGWRPAGRAGAEEWTPDSAAALALLEDADRLAAEGRFDEAVRLLLQRSVGQIATARPDWVEPSSTARELALLPALPDKARAAFALIAARVERSLFALRPLQADDWHAARAAYAEFALAQPALALAA